MRYDADTSVPSGGIQTRVPKPWLLKSGSHYDQLVYIQQEIIWKDIRQVLKWSVTRKWFQIYSKYLIICGCQSIIWG